MLEGTALLHWLDQDLDLLGKIFDRMPDVMFYVKDTQGRYVMVNQTLVKYSGRRNKEAVIGWTADEVFPVTGYSTMAHDLNVMQTGKELIDSLRLFFSPDGHKQWCLSSKYGIFGNQAQATGLVGISRILPKPDEKNSAYKRLMQFLDLVRDNIGQPLLISDIARQVNLSVDTLERLTKEVFQLTPKQILLKARIDKACELLESSAMSITDIASECGYSDHSAFSRQFKAASHCTPQQYRLNAKSATPAR
ncbi:helix-turn-helix domain-containing protein [Pseudomonas sp. R5(2019)]|uniref:helix-turn-helix domain-containing protein n=1 Tax=Pseudomonas sp. R5(2019) TaxID=2697566 RepID=UPI001412E6F0|nr:helix-turn-helix domain-containing protein [Pseudomonas sp. R5(2019)]NBA94874.1 helix-turn-helix domain-containing protein [Pseudomonas sp. R5(2019)]